MSSNPLHTPITFDDLTPTEVQVRVQGKDYLLREASGDAACKYRSAVLRCTKMRDGKPSGVDGAIADTEPYLVSLCLWEKYTTKGGEEKERNVRIDTIRGWPARVQAALFERVKAISGLSDAPSPRPPESTKDNGTDPDSDESASDDPQGTADVFPPETPGVRHLPETRDVGNGLLGNVKRGMVGSS